MPDWAVLRAQALAAQARLDQAGALRAASDAAEGPATPCKLGKTISPALLRNPDLAVPAGVTSHNLDAPRSCTRQSTATMSWWASLVH